MTNLFATFDLSILEGYFLNVRFNKYLATEFLYWTNNIRSDHSGSSNWIVTTVQKKQPMLKEGSSIRRDTWTIVMLNNS